MYRAVLDPGILIAALLSPHGAPGKLLLAWLDGRFELVASPKLLAELEQVLLRPKFRRYVTGGEAAEYVDLLGRLATIMADPKPEARVTPDPGDDYLVLLARSAGVHCLVSGDPHLTRLGRLQPPVLTPRAFLNLMKAE